MSKHILVFDSGLGGTTILGNIHQRLPHYHYSYAMDNGAFPYSNKSDDFLIQRTRCIFEQLIPLANPDLVVIACNTASTLILEKLRQQFSLPFVGVVPAIKPAAAASKNKVIGLLATQATISRHYIEQLHIVHGENCEMVRLGSQRLVEIAEDKMQGKTIHIQDIENELARLYKQQNANNIDVFILGCTHFPAIKNELMQCWPHPVVWIDSGEAVARRVETLSTTLPNKHNPITPTLYLTAPTDLDLKMKTIESFGIQNSHVIEITN